MGSGASKHRRELRRVQAAHVLRTRGAQQPRATAAPRAPSSTLRRRGRDSRKRCDCTHGDVEDVAERETVIRELEAMLGPQGGEGRVRLVSADHRQLAADGDHPISGAGARRAMTASRKTCLCGSLRPSGICLPIAGLRGHAPIYLQGRSDRRASRGQPVRADASPILQVRLCMYTTIALSSACPASPVRLCPVPFLGE